MTAPAVAFSEADWEGAAKERPGELDWKPLEGHAIAPGTGNDRPVRDLPVADHAHRVDENRRIDRIQRPALPGLAVTEHWKVAVIVVMNPFGHQHRSGGQAAEGPKHPPVIG